MCERFINKFTEKIIEKNKNPLKLYLIKKSEFPSCNYGQFADIVVAAYIEEEAIKICSNRYEHLSIEKIIQIGTACEKIKSGVISDGNVDIS